MVNKPKNRVNVKLEVWRDALESKDFRLSWTKTEYMKYNLVKLEIKMNNSKARWSRDTR